MTQQKIEKLAKLIKDKNSIEDKISAIIERPALTGHVGEYIAEQIFDIKLNISASQKGSDGAFTKGLLAGKTVNVKWHGKQDNLLPIGADPSSRPDFYLVMTGPKTGPVSSRGSTRPWCISSVFLFDANQLVGSLRNTKLSEATSVKSHLWDSAMIYPDGRNSKLKLSDTQKKLLKLFEQEFKGHKTMPHPASSAERSNIIKKGGGEKMKKVLVMVLVALLVFNFSCATILDGAKSPEKRSHEIQWGYVVLDVLFTGLLGLIIDFADGAIYKEKYPGSGALEEDIKHHLVDLNIPVYRFTNDKVFAVTLSEDSLVYTEVERNSLPQGVLRVVEQHMK